MKESVFITGGYSSNHARKAKLCMMHKTMSQGSLRMPLRFAANTVVAK